jgi:glycine/D-amino acid oxidase-like deaminating enzyme
MGAAHYDAAIIGGGFFGCRLALALAETGARVVVLEREAELLQRASYRNQARVHQGYHYPRSVLTALRSRVNFPRFVEEYRECIVDGFDHYYAIAKVSSMSKVSAAQFRTFCARIGAPLEPAPADVKRLFRRELIDDVFRVVEYAFDAVRLKRRLADDLARAGVEVRLGTDVVDVRAFDDATAEVRWRADGDADWLCARRVFNCTYAGLNRIRAAAGLPPVPLKFELTEIALIEMPEALRGIGVTVMCGPFFSTMPFPARGLHSLSHVRYTPHASWSEGSDRRPIGDPLGAEASRRSRFPHMVRDAQRFVPTLAGCRYVESLWEIKVVLPQGELDDSRPILCTHEPGPPAITSILGAKIDNVYDMLAELEWAKGLGGRA